MMGFGEAATGVDVAWVTLSIAAAVTAIICGFASAIARRTRLAWTTAVASAIALAGSPVALWLAARARAETLGGGPSMTWWFALAGARAYALLAVALAVIAIASMLEKN